MCMSCARSREYSLPVLKYVRAIHTETVVVQFTATAMQLCMVVVNMMRQVVAFCVDRNHYLAHSC